MMRKQTRRMRRGLSLRLVVVCAALGGVASYTFTTAMHPTFRATTTLLVGDLLSNSNISKDDLDASQQIATFYGILAREEPVLTAASEQLGGVMAWQQLLDKVHVDVAANGVPIITVTTSAGSPQEAGAIASAVAQALVQLSPADAAFSQDTSQTFLAERATRLQDDISLAQTVINGLEMRKVQGARSTRAVQAQIATEQRQILAWQANYVALRNLVASATSPNRLRILQPTESDPQAVAPTMGVNVALGAAAAGLVALALLYMLAPPDRSRSEGRRDDRGRRLDWDNEGAMDPAFAARRSAADDAWARELRTDRAAESPYAHDEAPTERR